MPHTTTAEASHTKTTDRGAAVPPTATPPATAAHAAKGASTTDAIIRALSLRPGAGPKQLVQLTGRGWGSVDNAVHKLVRSGAIREQRLGRSRSFFLAGQSGAKGYMIRGAKLRLLEAVRMQPGADAKGLSLATQIDQSDIYRLGAQLEKIGLIGRVKLQKGFHHFPNAVAS